MEAKKGVVALTNEEKILEMLAQINTRLDSLETKVDSLAESQGEIRSGLNAVLEWTDTVSTVVPIVPKIS